MSVLNRALNDMLTSKRSAASTGTSAFSGGFLGGIFSGAKGVGAVNYKKALTLSAVYCAVEMKSDSLGIIPFHVYKKTEKGRDRQVEHPVDWLLTQDPDGPNGIMTPFNEQKLIGQSLALRGNCLFRIISNGAGDFFKKYIPWDEVTDIRKFNNPDGSTTYIYITQKDGRLLSSEVLHYKGLSFDGVVGVSVLTYAFVNLGLAIEVQQFSYTNFEAKGVRQGVVESEKALKPEAKEAIITGVKNAFGQKSPDRVAVLDEGMTWKAITVTPQEAQLIEQARFSIEDIARWFNVPPHKLKSMVQSTNNNIEQQSLDFLVESVQPWVTNKEQEDTKKLISFKERKEGFYVKGNVNVILRTDLKTKAEYYSKGVNSGVFTPNEVRAWEELNALPGGDELRFPVNTQTQSQIDNQNNDNGN